MLAAEDIAALDDAGAAGYTYQAKSVLRRVACVALATAAVYEALKFFGINLL